MRCCAAGFCSTDCCSLHCLLRCGACSGTLAGRRFFCSPGWGKFGKTFTFVSDDHHVGQDGNLIIVVEKYGEDRTLNLGFLLKGGLVCLVTEKYVTYSDFVARLFLKFSYYTTFDRLPLLGHNYWCCHCYSIIGYKSFQGILKFLSSNVPIFRVEKNSKNKKDNNYAQISSPSTAPAASRTIGPSLSQT